MSNSDSESRAGGEPAGASPAVRLDAADRSRLESAVRRLAVPRHPVESPEALRAAEEFIAAEFAGLGLPVLRQTFSWREEEFANVVATLPGTDPTRPWVIVGAHFDSVAHSPGADDNASGVAAVLEIARLLAGSTFAATIQFVGFNLEEVQRWVPPAFCVGSRAYVAWLKNQVARVRGAFVLEMVGFTGPGQRIPAAAALVKRVPEGGRFLAAVGDASSRELLGTMERAAAGVVELVTLEVPFKGFVVPDTRRSDNARFWDAGFPALMVTDTANLRNPHYHRWSDTPETLDYGFMSRVVAVVAGAVAGLAVEIPHPEA
jgi:aminopeptidase YwaD